MSEVEELRKARSIKNVNYTIFLSEYDKSGKVCYGFVEGKTDPPFYKTQIDRVLPREYKIRLYPAGNKKSVKYIHDIIDWNRFPQKMIVFFIDRDISDLVDDPNLFKDDNAYITDKYSMENEIVNSEVLDSLMRDIMGFASNSQSEIDCIVSLFDTAKASFEEYMTFIMANIIYWKRNSIQDPEYANIEIKKLIEIKNGVLSYKMDKSKLVDYIYSICKVDVAQYDKSKIEEILSEISEKYLREIIVRGKYMSEFFILFCKSIHDDYRVLGLNKTHSGCCLNVGDVTKSIAPRCRTVTSLKLFVEKTLLEYIKSKQNVA